MSDTPRTDEVYNSVCFFTDEQQAVDALADLRDLAQELELENAALREDKARLDFLEGRGSIIIPPAGMSFRYAIDAIRKDAQP